LPGKGYGEPEEDGEGGEGETDRGLTKWRACQHNTFALHQC